MIRNILLLIMLMFLTTSCTSIGMKVKEWISGKPAEQQVQAKAGPTSFSQAKKVGKVAPRNYQRMTKEKMQQQAQLNERSGSLWVMEGQGAYLFSQNTARMVGDLLNIKIDGQPEQQLITKVNVIKDLLAKLEAQAEARRLASLPASQQAGGGDATAPQQQAPASAPSGGGGEQEFEVKAVPTRIVELLKDGNYRVKGDQPFMIGKREYKVIVTGIIRPTDFDDAGISAEKLLDPKFDIVSLRKPGAG